MSIAVLSPCVLETRGKDEFQHFAQLSEFIQNLYSFTDLKFQIYKKAPYDGYKMEIPIYRQYSNLNNLVTVTIYGTIQKMLSDEYIDLDNVPAATLPGSFRIGSDPISIAFRSYLNYLSGCDALLFIGEDNCAVPRPIEVQGETTYCINTSTYLFLELSNILLPYLKNVDDVDAIFPRALFCSKYNDYVLQTISDNHLDQAGKNAIFESIGGVVAGYNLYTKNNRLSRMNSTNDRRRIVYEKSIGKKYFLSLDLESGGFEVFDRRYQHLGQFSFSGDQDKPADPRNHKLNH